MTVDETRPRRIRLAVASDGDLEAIYRARHQVYAAELGQYEFHPEGILKDDPDRAGLYIVAHAGRDLIGFVGITPPSSPRYSLDKYLPRAELPLPFGDHLYEIRALTVLRPFRGFLPAGMLMYAAFRWIEAHGGQHIVAIGRREVLDMYLRVGMKPLGRSFQTGAVTYELISATVDEVGTALRRYGAGLSRVEKQVDWQVGVAFRRPADCYHGGAFFAAVGEEFDDLGRRERIINADVLDAWFPPAPGVLDVLQKNLDWLVRTSPPTHAEGMVRMIARTRGVDPASLLVAGGSSPLIFTALPHWLNASSRVLVLDPAYGEYAHVLENIVGCHVERLRLNRQDGYALDPKRLAARMKDGYDLVVWVNPNNPTGLHVPRSAVEAVLRQAPPATRFWLDETYVEYAGPGQSLEPFAAQSGNVVVVKSMSKVYALSGLRVGYLCGPPALINGLRPLNPPWAVSLPAQVAAVRALQDPAYYAARYQETHALRKQLEGELRMAGLADLVPGMANYVLVHLPPDGPAAAEVVAACREQGLFLRDAGATSPALGRRAIRIAVKDAETNRRMVEILKGVMVNRKAGPPQEAGIL